MVEVQDLDGLIAGWVRSGRARHHRRGLVLCGGRTWAMTGARRIPAATGLERVLWVGTQAPEGVRQIPAAKARGVLGQEVEVVVYDAFSGFDPDAFGAVSGLIVGGGLLVLLTPPLVEWPRYPDPELERVTVYPYPPSQVKARFLRRLVDRIRHAQGLLIVEEGVAPPGLQAEQVDTLSARNHAQGPGVGAAALVGDACKTEDQRRAVEAVTRVVAGQRRRPVVLMSDRGRGKSAAMGIAAARLLRERLTHIVVTGPSLSAVEPIFSHARALLPEAHASRAAVHMGGRRMEFIAPDQVLRTAVRADLLLVDEAAAIPAPLLEQMLRRYSRIAFATTVHGYEGTGRGFALRFGQVLNRHTRGWKTVTLDTPVRWAPGDPVERFVFQALLLETSPAPDQALRTATAEACRIERLDRDVLAADEKTLSELFGLLVLAHYRTRPYDLRHLLDGPNMEVYAMYHDEYVVGTALVAREGGFDAGLAHAVWEGRTRPHGHLIPETLGAHLGLLEAPRLRGARVVRIAIHPAVQARGLGSRLLRHLVGTASADGLDYLGTSFGATRALLRFWSREGFKTLRVSVRRGATSGAHSVLLMRAVNGSGEALVSLGRRRLCESFPHLLADPLRDLDPDLALDLLCHGAPHSVDLDPQDWLDLVSFAFGRRIYEACLAPVFKLTLKGLTQPGGAPALVGREQKVLVLKVLQRREWLEVAQPLGISGRAGVVAVLRGAVRGLIQGLADPVVRAEVAALMDCSLEAGGG